MAVPPTGDASVVRLLLVDEPYVSPSLRAGIAELGLPLVLTEAARELGFAATETTLDEDEAVALAERAERLLVLTSSENALGWLAEALPRAPFQDAIRCFKDKALFRERTAALDPDFFFRRVLLGDLELLSQEDLPLPLILKPSVGFFSMGVMRIGHPRDWGVASTLLQAEIERYRGIYPEVVLGTRDFLLEACIPGDEFAIDAYLDEHGAPVILSIWKHAFASDEDMGDRVYSTSRQLIVSHLADFTAYLHRIAKLTEARDMPLHVELRRSETGELGVIEVNPMRFGGWCTTGDLTKSAYGHDPYQLFFEGRQPDWATALGAMGERTYSIVVLNNSTGHDGRDIAAFDYESLLARFAKPLELRRVDFARFPLFGFLFLETPPEQAAELDWILHSDLTEFVALRDRGRG